MSAYQAVIVGTFSCPHCGRRHANPAKSPRCETCDDDGYVDIVDDCGGVVGPAPCPNCSSADAFEVDGFTVLGRCMHGVDLDREFCPEGCRV